MFQKRWNHVKVHRLMSILLLIESRGTIKANELAEKLEVSLRTIYRDIDTLCELGVPLTTTTGPNGGIHLMEGYSSGLNHLHEQDLMNLYLSGMGIQPVKESDMSIKLNHTLLKLQQHASIDGYTLMENMNKRFHFDEDSWWQDPIRLLDIDDLLSAVFRSSKIRITYEKVNGTSSIRIIHPYGIVVKRADWYVIGFCELSDEIRTFKCERIKAAETLKEEFLIPLNFSLQQYWDASKQAFIGKLIKAEQYHVQLSMSADYARHLSGYEVLSRLKNDSGLLLTINLYDYEYAKSVIYEQLPYIEVLQPEELRKTIQQTLEYLLDKYKNNDPH